MDVLHCSFKRRQWFQSRSSLNPNVLWTIFREYTHMYNLITKIILNYFHNKSLYSVLQEVASISWVGFLNPLTADNGNFRHCRSLARLWMTEISIEANGLNHLANKIRSNLYLPNGIYNFCRRENIKYRSSFENRINGIWTRFRFPLSADSTGFTCKLSRLKSRPSKSRRGSSRGI